MSEPKNGTNRNPGYALIITLLILICALILIARLPIRGMDMSGTWEGVNPKTGQHLSLRLNQRRDQIQGHGDIQGVGEVTIKGLVASNALWLTLAWESPNSPLYITANVHSNEAAAMWRQGGDEGRTGSMTLKRSREDN